MSYDGCIPPAIHHVVFAHTIEVFEQLKQQTVFGHSGAETRRLMGLRTVSLSQFMNTIIHTSML